MSDEKAESPSEPYDRLIGSLFILGFEGTEITPQIRSLIEQHHVGSICISAKNLVGAFMARPISRLGSHSLSPASSLLMSLRRTSGYRGSVIMSRSSNQRKLIFYLAYWLFAEIGL